MLHEVVEMIKEILVILSGENMTVKRGLFFERSFNGFKEEIYS